MFSNPVHNIKQFMLGEGMVVVDAGCGAGAHTIHAGHAVGPEGRVYAIDVRDAVLGRVRREAKEAGLANIETVRADLEKSGSIPLANETADAVLVTSVLCFVEDKELFADEVARTLRSGGKILVIDWAGSYGGIGPPEYMLVAKPFAEQLFRSVGFNRTEHINVGSYHWGFIARKP